MKPRNIFHTIIVVAGLCLTWMIPFNSYSAEIYISPLVVNIGQSFSFHVTTKNLVELKSYTLSLHLPLETVSQVSTIDPVGDEYSTFTVESYFDTNLESVVWNISATMKQPVYGDRTLFRVNAKAADRGGYSDIGMAAISGELTSAFVHGGSIYVLDPTWPWYDVQINYQNAFHRLDVDGSGLEIGRASCRERV